mgnify:FL=1
MTSRPTRSDFFIAPGGGSISSASEILLEMPKTDIVGPDVGTHDYFFFTAERGGRVFVDVAHEVPLGMGSGDTPFDLTIRQGSDYETITQDHDARNPAVDFLVEEGSRYYLQIVSQDGDSVTPTGGAEYSLSTTFLESDDSTNVREIDPHTLQVGDVHEESVGYGNDNADWYRVSPSESGTATLELSGVDEALIARLYEEGSANHSETQSVDRNENATIEFSVGGGQDYDIMVEPLSSENASVYSVGLDFESGAGSSGDWTFPEENGFSPSQSSVQLLDGNSEHSESVGDGLDPADYYRISFSPDDMQRINLEISGERDIIGYSVYDVNGEEIYRGFLDSFSGSGSLYPTEIDFDLDAQPGTIYYAKIRDELGASDYTISTGTQVSEGEPAPSDLADGRYFDGTYQYAYGSVQTDETVSFSADFESGDYLITVGNNDRYAPHAVPPYQIRVLDAAGNELATGLRSAAFSSIGGEYFIEIERGNSEINFSDNFFLSAFNTDDLSGNSLFPPEMNLSVGDAVRSVSTNGYPHIFAVDLVAGREYLFEMSATSGSRIDSSLTRLARKSDPGREIFVSGGTSDGDVQFTYTAEASDTYIFEANGLRTKTGGYTVSVQETGGGSDPEPPSDNGDPFPDIDAGDSFGQATTLGTTATRQESLGFGDDEDDYFRVTAPADGDLTVALSGLSADLDLLVFDSDQEGIVILGQRGLTDEVHTIPVNEGSEYFIWVNPLYDAQSEYTVTTDFDASSGSEPDPEPPTDDGDPFPNIDAGDRQASATTLDIGDVRTESVGYEGDDFDWYRLMVPEDGIVTAILGGATADLDIGISDPNQNWYWTSPIRGTSDESQRLRVDSGDEVLVGVRPFESAQSAYNVTTSFEVDFKTQPPTDEGDPLPDVDPGDGFAAAVTLDASATRQESVGFGYYYFRVTAPTDGDLTVSLTELTADLDLLVFDSDRNVIDQSTAGGPSDEAATVSVEGGERYFVCVVSDNFFGSEYTEYTLTTEFEAAQDDTPTEPEPPVDDGVRDLVVTDLTLGSTTWADGDTITVGWTLENIGGSNAINSESALYISTDSNITTGDTQLLRDTSTGIMNPGETNPEGEPGSFTLDLAALGVGPGTYYVGAHADILDEVSESDESNNVSPIRTVTIEDPTPPPASDPDLVVTDLTLGSTTWADGDTITVGWTLENIGGSNAINSESALYISTDSNITTGDTQLLRDTSTGIMNPGETNPEGEPGSFTLDLAALGVGPGTYYVGAHADILDEVSESDEGNNVSPIRTVRIEDPTPPQDDGFDLIGNVDDYRIIAHGDTLVFRHQGFVDSSGLGRAIARVQNVERFEGVDLADLTVEDGFDLRAREVFAGGKTFVPLEYLGLIRDFDGNDLGAPDGWKFIGTADAQYDGDAEHVYVNPEIGRWATVGPDANGTVDFGDHGEGGDTRVVGIYIDPLVESGEVERGSDIDSQRRFQNDLEIDNLELQTAFDFDADGFQEMYFKTVDGTAYLRALMHADGNIQYANYQSEYQVWSYLDGLGYDQDVIDTILV